jgi:ketosteroid isomerase-like protein
MPELEDDAGIRDLQRRWAEAEVRGDVAALDALATEDFRLVGPVGFVLDKRQWLDRYAGGDLVTSALSFEDVQTRFYGDTALTIGRHVQRAEYQGHPADGQFRASHIAVRGGDGWRLAGCQLSPIGGPPPFTPPGQRGKSEQSEGRPGPAAPARVELNHIIVPARDKVASADFLAGILGVPAGPPSGGFMPVVVGNGVTLDYATRERFEPHHCAFLVSEEEFDGAFARIRESGTGYYAQPDRSLPGDINRRFGGRGVYFDDPNGHLMEILTSAG